MSSGKVWAAVTNRGYVLASVRKLEDAVAQASLSQAYRKN
jgi:hypothetical protein